MDAMRWLEALSYLVTIVGLPFAIGVYVYDRRRDRQNDEEETARRGLRAMNCPRGHLLCGVKA